ncbi:hypothetical protein Pmani_015719 [Petrolisthes manimaculis]|uniref:Cell death regulator Aven n=1 Tax=Petrolisthes manimaculis TaxID=1843537 RepID=A0AAE1PT33_9EUCA|nr:hypothetical protein Pmani_015719 [Petrolisthes manimaculis]
MPDRRRQRQQRVRHDAGDNPNSVGASNREPEPQNNANTKPRNQKPAGSGVAYAEPKKYESVTVMPDKEVAEPQKYRRQGIFSNWSRYDDITTDEPEEGEDYQVGEDFSVILEQQANCTGGYLKLKGEASWDKDEASILTSHGLGALHVADLVAAVNTLPLYTQLNIPEESLPESVVRFYTQLAADNRKVYKPNKEYKDCSEINEKLIQSLLINESEPLNLVNEEPETPPATKNAVDVALSLTEAFAPEPGDVDLNTFLQEQSEEKDASPVHQPSQVNAGESYREQIPAKQINIPNKSRESTPVQQTNVPEKSREPTPVKQHTGLEKSGQSMTQKQVNEPEKSPVPAAGDVKSNKQQKLKGKIDPRKEKIPGTFDFGLSKVDTSINTKGKKDNKDKVPDAIDVSDPLKITDEVKEEVEGPSIDLDAPIEPTNPVIITETEKEDLEDWLDSVLDD